MNAPSPEGYLRHPTIAGDAVVFCCADELWSVPATGGTAHRLTAGGPAASAPWLSPDGTRIAFVGTVDSRTDVYVVDADGGAPTQLTHDGARCEVAGWEPGTHRVVFASTAGQPADFGLRLFVVHDDGGPPELLHRGPGAAVTFGPDGRRVLGRSLADPARRKRYSGGAAGELWLETPDGFVAVDVPLANPAWPCWVGERIYLVSDHDGVGNVYSLPVDGGPPSRHSDHTDWYARRLTGDGTRLTYAAGGVLYLLDPSDGTSHPIEVRLPGARATLGPRTLAGADHLEQVRLTAGGTEVLAVLRGQALAFAPWSGPVRRLAPSTGTRYRLLDRLGRSGTPIAVAADTAPGERLVDLDTGATILDLTDLGVGCELAAAPGTDRVAFTTTRQQLWLLDLARPSPEPVLLDESPHDRIEDLAWSPDGRWLAYSRPESAGTAAIVLADGETGAITRVATPVARDWAPAFDPAGRFLYFLGQRDLVPDYDQVHYGIGFPFGSRPYLVTLSARTGVPPDFAVGDGPDEPVRVRVDLDGIGDRIVPLPVPQDRYATIAPLRDSVLLLRVPAQPPAPGRVLGTSVVALDLRTGEVDPDHLVAVDELVAAPDGTALAYRAGEQLRVLPGEHPGDAERPEHAEPGRLEGWVALDRLRVEIDPVAEWRQMLREAWRLQRESFWEAAMGGLDWDAVYERYAPVVERLGGRHDLSDLLWELHGELATSHAYERDGDHGPAGPAPGRLGLDWLPRAPGDPPRWRVDRVVRGDPWNPAATSPCTAPGVDVRRGDEIVAVDGQPVGPSGPDALLAGRAGQDVELTVVRPGHSPRRVTVRAAADEGRARYLDLVHDTRATVHARTGGRVGYLHVPDTFAAGYADFVRGLLAEGAREALLVDVRGNGGGNASGLLLDALSRRRGGVEYSRWGRPVPIPPEAPGGPVVVLVDEQTGSDAGLFAHQFRRRGLGRLVGRRTWGGTVATWPRHRLVDGTLTTQPEFRHLLDAGDVATDLENHGLVPDLVVAQPPDHADADAVLTAALDLLLADLDRPTVAPVGTPLARRAAARADR